VQDDDGSVVDRQSAEGPLQLVPVSDRVIGVGRDGLVGCGYHRIGCPLRLPLRFGIADPHQQSVRPAFEAVGITQATDVAPDAQQRLLYRVLRKVRVAQDADRDGLQAGVAFQSQRFERLLVTLLCS
jgi:hypothetical protein